MPSSALPRTWLKSLVALASELDAARGGEEASTSSRASPADVGRRQFALLAASVTLSGCGDVSSSPASASSAGAAAVGAGSSGGNSTAGSAASSAGEHAVGNGSAGSGAGGEASAGDGSAGDGSAGSSASGSAAGGSSSMPPVGAGTKSKKRGIAYNELVDAEDFEALASGVSWWYNWGTKPGAVSAATARKQYGMDFIPMVWGASFNDEAIVSLLSADPDIHYLLVLNEPNLMGQAYVTPAAAAALWPRIERIAENTGVKTVGPQITWGNMVVEGTSYADPIAWLDAFYAAYQAAHGGERPRVDYLGFHWYDYGLAAQLDRLEQYDKPFWVTEIANWHTGDGDAAIDTVEKQKRQMTEMIATCEARADVHRYAWFTGRLGANDKDVHYTSLLAQAGTLTELGEHYVGLPFDASAP